MTILTFVWVIVSSIRTNRARCAIYKKILIYSTRKAFLEKAVVELVYKFDEKSYRECLKGESIAKVRFNFFCPQIYLYTHIYIWTPTPITLPCLRCACGVKIHFISGRNWGGGGRENEDFLPRRIDFLHECLSG